MTKTDRKAAVEATSDTRPAPFDKEKLRIDAARERWIDRTPPVQVCFPEGVRAIRSPHSDDSGHLMRLGDTFGTRSGDFLAVQISELDSAVRNRGKQGATEQEINAGIALISAIAPEDELEAALAVQMAQNHALTTDLLGRACGTENFDQMQAFGNLAVKLQRTFTAQIEALARMRGKGQQTVRVEHVTVEAGAQAIVGDVHHHPPGATGGNSKTAEQPHEASGTAARTRARQALPSPDPQGNGVPIPSNAERPLPHPRRTVARRAGRKPQRLQARPLEPGNDRDAPGAADDAS